MGVVSAVMSCDVTAHLLCFVRRVNITRKGPEAEPISEPIIIFPDFVVGISRGIFRCDDGRRVLRLPVPVVLGVPAWCIRKECFCPPQLQGEQASLYFPLSV